MNYRDNDFIKQCIVGKKSIYRRDLDAYSRTRTRRAFRAFKTNMSNINTSSIIADSTIPATDNASAQQSTTNFVADEANVNIAAVQQHSDLIGVFNSNLSVYKRQDIAEFLRKPLTLSTGVFTTTDTGILATYTPYQTLVTTAMYQRKMEGHLAFRAKLVVRIVINANRFQQGRYFLAFFPTAGASASANQTSAWLNLHTATLCQRTQLNRVEFDINRDTEAVIEIPWMSAYSHMPVRASYANTFGVPGNILLCAYAPLVAPTGSTTASYTIYAHFEDVELCAPTAPQARINFKSSAKRGISTATDVSSQEQAQAGLGPISSLATKVSKTMDIMSEIPMLSSITAPVSWFSDIVSRAASVFGWSSPLDLSEVSRAVQTIFPFANNCDMPNAAMPLSLFARNQLEIISGVGATDIDETAIDHIKTIPAYFTFFSFSTTDLVGDVIKTQQVGYTDYSNIITDNGRTITAYAPVSYLAQFFTHFRGGMVFKFKVISTEFHSGRYAITFYPYESLAGSTGLSGEAYAFREIIDLRMGCEFTFTVPYTSIPNYRRIGSNQYFGSWRVTCVNPLVAPASVSSTTRVVVEVAGAPDVEYAYLRSATLSISAPSAPQSAVKFVSSENEITSGSIGNSKQEKDNCQAARHCIGEKALSLLSILKHNNEVKFTTPTANLSAYIDPFFIQTGAYIGAANADSLIISDHYAMFVSMFATSRGATRWKVTTPGDTTAVSQVVNSHIVFSNSNLSGGINENAAAIPPGRFSLSVLQNAAFRGGTDIQTPPYHHTYARTNVNLLVGTIATLPIDYSASTSHNMRLVVNTSSSNISSYYRQVADDFHMAMFISTPCTATL